MRRLFYSLGIFIFLASTVHPVFAGAPGDSCSVLSAAEPRSDACDREIIANPLPEFTRPVKFDGTKQGVSHPRSILLPKEALPYEVGWMVRDWPYSDTP